MINIVIEPSNKAGYRYKDNFVHCWDKNNLCQVTHFSDDFAFLFGQSQCTLAKWQVPGLLYIPIIILIVNPRLEN